MQPGLPFIEAKLVCDDEAKPKLALSQSRYLPAGSTGQSAQTWQVPVCARYSIGPNIRRTCTLLTAQQGEMLLEGRGCPAWIVPNADAAGYYRWSLPPKQLQDLVKKGQGHLSVRERMTVAQAFRAAFGRGTTLAGDVMTGIAPLAKDEHPEVATAPMSYVRNASWWLEGDPLEKNVAAYAKKLYAPAWERLGWNGKKKEGSEQQLLRQEVLSFLVFTARDANVRKQAVEKARAYLGIGKDDKIHPEAVDPNLAGIVLAVAGQDADAALFDAMLARFAASQDEVLRGRLLGALASVTRPELAARARELALDSRLKVIEVMTPIGVQMNQKETREAAWKFFVERLDALSARLPPGRAAGLAWMGTNFCDAAKASEVERIFGPRAAKMEGGPRNLAGALESIRLCATRKDLHLASAKAFFKNQN
jgi:alanyl aminopeptidase